MLFLMIALEPYFLIRVRFGKSLDERGKTFLMKINGTHEGGHRIERRRFQRSAKGAVSDTVNDMPRD